MPKLTLLIAALLCCLATPLPLAAAEPSTETAEGQNPAAAVTQGDDACGDGPPPETLDTIVVVGKHKGNPENSVTLDRLEIEALPAGNGNVNDLLILLPGVQMSEEARSSVRGGEILPQELSISGGSPFGNNYTIDGLSINSYLDPELQDKGPNSGAFIPDRSQDLFLNSSLLEVVRVLGSNVPAEYGEFTGGVVEAETIDPSPYFWGTATLRTTRDEWTTFHLIEEDREDFENSNASVRNQPNFEKYEGGVTLNIPLGEESGLLASYQIIDSQIPINQLGAMEDETRRLENYFLKWSAHLTPADTLSATFLYTPYREERFYPDALDSDYTVEGGGMLFSADYERLLSRGDFRLRASHRRKENERRAPQHLFFWQQSTTKPWGALVGSDTSVEGMVGSIKSKQEGSQIKIDLTLNPVHTGELSHRLKTGIDYERIEGETHRAQDSFQFYSPVVQDLTTTSPTVVSCDPSDIGCIDGEQFFKRRTVFPAGDAEAQIDNYRGYLEDLMQFRRLQLRPGLRVSYDDLQKNTNLSPRLSAEYDLFGNDRTIFFGGLNRYHDKTLLAFALREAATPSIIESRTFGTETANSPDPWPSESGGNPRRGSGYRITDLKTPFTDEITAGLRQELLGGETVLRYIHRKGKDQFARERGGKEADGVRYYSLNNNGNFRHESYSLSWERRWQRHYLSMNATYQQTEASNLDYSDTFDGDDVQEWIMYKGEVMLRSELPRTDFNRPWTANLILTSLLPYGFEFTNVTRYRSSYVGRETVGIRGSKTKPLPADAPPEVDRAYGDVKKPRSWLFDWKVTWRKDIGSSQQLALSLEAYNVFDEKIPLEDSDDDFELGRQLWAGMEYAF